MTRAEEFDQLIQELEGVMGCGCCGGDLGPPIAALRAFALRESEGEVYGVTKPIVDGWPENAVILPAFYYPHGTRVRVTKVEEK